MLEAKVTSKGQITIPIEIRKKLGVDTGDVISFQIKEAGIVVEKANRPQTIQERFANYDVSTEKNDIGEAMKEFDVGETVGEEQ